jgi:hypothetical protein
LVLFWYSRRLKATDSADCIVTILTDLGNIIEDLYGDGIDYTVTFACKNLKSLLSCIIPVSPTLKIT